jgi:hypothetical protein
MFFGSSIAAFSNGFKLLDVETGDEIAKLERFFEVTGEFPVYEMTISEDYIFTAEELRTFADMLSEVANKIDDIAENEEDDDDDDYYDDDEYEDDDDMYDCDGNPIRRVIVSREQT